MAVIPNGLKTAIVGATAVTVTAVIAGAATNMVVVLSVPALTAYFGFLGGLVMQRVLG